MCTLFSPGHLRCGSLDELKPWNLFLYQIPKLHFSMKKVRHCFLHFSVASNIVRVLLRETRAHTLTVVWVWLTRLGTAVWAWAHTLTVVWVWLTGLGKAVWAWAHTLTVVWVWLTRLGKAICAWAHTLTVVWVWLTRLGKAIWAWAHTLTVVWVWLTGLGKAVWAWAHTLTVVWVWLARLGKQYVHARGSSSCFSSEKGFGWSTEVCILLDTHGDSTCHQLQASHGCRQVTGSVSTPT